MFTKPLNKILLSSFVALALGTTIIYGENTVPSKACQVATRDGASMDQVITASFETILNVFPISFAGVALSPGGQYGDTVNGQVMCTCPAYPIVQEGIVLTYWEPIAIVEPTSIPHCSAFLGDTIGSSGAGAKSWGTGDGDGINNLTTYQAHYIKYYFFSLIRMLVDSNCQNDGGDGIDYGYVTEYDALWQNDTWNYIIAPETALVANPIAQMSCMADAVSSSVGFPIDAMTWCLGSWGSAFPWTMNVAAVTPIEAQASIVSRLLMKMHRQFMIWPWTWVCSRTAQPVMQKSLYGIFPVYPVLWPYRIPIGRTGLLWQAGHDNPANQRASAWMVYQKVKCCAW